MLFVICDQQQPRNFQEKKAMLRTDLINEAISFTLLSVPGRELSLQTDRVNSYLPII